MPYINKPSSKYQQRENMYKYDTQCVLVIINQHELIVAKQKHIQVYQNYLSIKNKTNN